MFKHLFEDFLTFCQGLIVSLTGTPVEKLNWKIFQNDELLIIGKKNLVRDKLTDKPFEEMRNEGVISERNYQHTRYLNEIWKEKIHNILREIETENSELKLRRNLLLAQQEVIHLASCFDKHEQVTSQISKY
jgi:hypothetical protein